MMGSEDQLSILMKRGLNCRSLSFITNFISNSMVTCSTLTMELLSQSSLSLTSNNLKMKFHMVSEWSDAVWGSKPSILWPAMLDNASTDFSPLCNSETRDLFIFFTSYLAPWILPYSQVQHDGSNLTIYNILFLGHLLLLLSGQNGGSDQKSYHLPFLGIYHGHCYAVITWELCQPTECHL